MKYSNRDISQLTKQQKIKLVDRRRRECKRLIRFFDFITCLVLYLGVKGGGYGIVLSFFFAYPLIRKSYDLHQEEKDLKRKFHHLYN